MRGMVPPHLNANIDLILCDLDNTMYARDLGVWAEIDARIRGYVISVAGCVVRRGP